MTKTAFLNVHEVSEVLGTSKPHAYKVMKQLNNELKQQGYIVIAGKINRSYFEERIYKQQGGE